MFSESTQKQLQLVLGIFAALVAIISAAADLLKKIEPLQGLAPWWAPWAVYVALFAFGVWLLYKRGTRHSHLLKPDALRLERDNTEHLVGRAEDINNLLQQCLAKQIVFLEGESGSGKSALVRAGLLPRLKDEKSVLPLLLSDRWVDDWDRSPFQALKTALITGSTLGSGIGAKPPDGERQAGARRPSTLADVEEELTRLSDEAMRTPLIIFDQFDDYQARNRERFLPNKTWLDPATLRQTNVFWDMVARLVEQEKLHCMFVTRSDTAAGLSSVEFLGSVQALRLDRVPSPSIAQLLRRLTEDGAAGPVIADPESGWTKLRDRIVSDISEQNVILPQQLKIMLGGIQSLKWLNVAQYEGVGGATGIEAFYIEQQISGAARKVGLDDSQVRAMLVALIDPLNPTKTWPRSKEDLIAAAAKGNGKQAAGEIDNALEELERSEMLRGYTAPESGRAAYRLHHDYLTRGVSAVERRANCWHHLLQERAQDFQNAGGLWKKWKALLPVGTQCQLLWERLRGRFRYGTRRSYAVLSLALFPIRIVSAAGTLLLILFIGMIVYLLIYESRPLEETAGAEVRSTLKDLHSMTDPNEIRKGISRLELYIPILAGKSPEEVRALAAETIEQMQSATNADQMNVLADAIAIIVRKLEPEKGQTLAGSILQKIQSTTDAAQLSALRRGFAAISAQLPPENARALADPILQAIKGSRHSSQRHALGLALAAIAARLKPDEAEPLDGSIVDAIQGGRTLH
jgi:hypothetical protein